VAFARSQFASTQFTTSGTPIVVVPPSGTPGGAARRPGRVFGAPYFEEEKKQRVEVLLEKTTPSGAEFQSVSWEADATLSELQQAIKAVLDEMGNLDATMAQSEMLRRKLKAFKKKRNMRIIMMALEDE
jgi:hypothetical protein